MIFTTYWFVVFAVVACAGLLLAPAGWVRLAWLLVASIIFHGHFAGAAGVAPIVVIGVATYSLALLGGRTACTCGIVFAAAALIVYKYGAFISDGILAPIHPGFGEAVRSAFEQILPAAPPLAISFFTFEFVHYLMEVRRGHGAIRNPAEFALFTIFFPSLAAGPIKRYGDFLPELRSSVARRDHERRLADLAAGVARIALGYGKKLLIADNLTGWIGQAEQHLGTASLAERWLFLAALAFRILADFSAYSDIAIGLARVLGIRLPENFNWPYVATSLQEFWGRWHISLSTWIRDYIPLGGNRYGGARRVGNAFAAMALCGLWHGPAWNFVLWGVYHGVGLGLSATYATAFGPVGRGIAAVLARAPIVGWALTTAFVWFGWLLFFYPVPRALEIARLLVTP